MRVNAAAAKALNPSTVSEVNSDEWRKTAATRSAKGERGTTTKA